MIGCSNRKARTQSSDVPRRQSAVHRLWRTHWWKEHITILFSNTVLWLDRHFACLQDKNFRDLVHNKCKSQSLCATAEQMGFKHFRKYFSLTANRFSELHTISCPYLENIKNRRQRQALSSWNASQLAQLLTKRWASLQQCRWESTIELCETYPFVHIWTCWHKLTFQLRGVSKYFQKGWL